MNKVYSMGRVNVLQLCIMSLLTMVYGLFYISCEKKSENEVVIAPQNQYMARDIWGTWILKGNSSITMLLEVHKNSGSDGFFNLIEFEIEGKKYNYRGEWSGDLFFSGSYNDTIKLVDPKGGGFWDWDYNATHRSYYAVFEKMEQTLEGKWHVEALTNNRLRITKGDLFFDGQKNTDYTSDTYNDGNPDNVDLGLSVNWAGKNVGANSTGEYGDLVGWGDPVGNKTSTVLNDYPTTYNEEIPVIISNTKYDIATQRWGIKWRMPTFRDIEELRHCCIGEEAQWHGIKGYKYTGITGRSIFLPSAGFREGETIIGQGVCGMYWVGERDRYYRQEEADYYGWNLWSTLPHPEKHFRFLGYSIRAICDK